jgi:hypothetical protein
LDDLNGARFWKDGTVELGLVLTRIGVLLYRGYMGRMKVLLLQDTNAECTGTKWRAETY